MKINRVEADEMNDFIDTLQGNTALNAAIN